MSLAQANGLSRRHEFPELRAAIEAEDLRRRTKAAAVRRAPAQNRLPRTAESSGRPAGAAARQEGGAGADDGDPDPGEPHPAAARPRGGAA
jgi:hypothetical protein